MNVELLEIPPMPHPNHSKWNLNLGSKLKESMQVL